jgi:soluble lytic murein transglycosylase
MLRRTAGAGDVDAESRLLRAKRLAQQGVWDQAEAEFRAVTTAARSGPLAGEAWYRLGEIYLYSDQRAAYDAFHHAAGLGWNVPGAWYWAASTARRGGLASQAREAVAALARFAPSGSWAARFWLDAGLRAESDGRSADAAAAYRRASAAAPSTDEAAESRWRLGWIALRAGRLADAEARFRTAAAEDVWRGDAARAWYWVAKTIEARTGRPNEGEAAAIVRMVAERYPFTFYGQRARVRLGSPAPLPLPSPLHVVPRDAAAPAYEELARLNLDADAAEAAEDALSGSGGAQASGGSPSGGGHAGRDPQIVRFLAEAYNRLGDVGQSVAYAEEALAAGLRDEAMWRLAYPRAHWPNVMAAAQAANIDPLFLLALVREESRYDAAVISPARAVGLAQLLPSTAQAMTNDASIGLQQLKDPALNLRLGARYIRMQLDRFGGDQRLALAAYNAGPGAARRWVGLDPDPDYFVEKIGFAETRAYIRRVLGSYGAYKLLW